ncbi:MAG: single-stranded-DNA-specific exonuclease RecJ [Bacteroidales bacterium]|nr:single-stranded-DNA-specific exonuclease RecJ [Bacteroidales bacterium]MDY0285997.1 single-stranded-DNA-specific exonuclease RecJ [Bacteroidales bacterium]HPE87218.1 single-stranded-DNA-specific exonuclease RecJ [Bacteroidales bacterium]
MLKRWVVKEYGETEAVTKLSRELGIDSVLANLLVQRGITDFNGAKRFFRPELSHLHNPFLMKDMDKAIDRIHRALETKEKILVYGDYDVDGTTAVALVYSFLKDLDANIDFYIPDRYAEGYGVSYMGIDYACVHNYSLVIALDCGIKAIEKISYARSFGIDFIIGDHHRPGDTLPDAVAVLDAKRADCAYPYKELSGCGVGFKLIQAYCQQYNMPFERLHPYLDLVVVSIAADIVPITGENRILAYFGLKKINSNPRPGLEAILQVSNVLRRKPPDINDDRGVFTRELTISDLVFVVGPRINAAGRLESGRNSVELLISTSYEEAKVLASAINDINNERRHLDNQATTEALEMILADPTYASKKTTVVYNPEWHKGVVGIVASRLTDNYYRPTVVLTKSNGLITGSARSVKNFDVYDAIDACSDLLEHFGGHTYAAGLSMKEENLEAFTKKFERIVDESIDMSMLVPEIEVDMEIRLSTINTRFYRILKQFAPFGPGNMSPVFLTNGLVDTGVVRLVGKNEDPLRNHLKLTVIHPDESSYPQPAIAFQQGEYYSKIAEGQLFSIVYHVEQNEWNGTTTLQLNIKDIKIIP